MADLELALVGEIFKFYDLNLWGKWEGARTFHDPKYGYSVSIKGVKGDYAIVRTSSSRGQGLKFPRGLRLRKFDELVKDLCSPGCKVSAVTTIGGSSKKWIPFEEGVIRVDGPRSMTVFKRDGSVKRITDVLTWGAQA